MLPIAQVAANSGIAPEELELFGESRAKIKLSVLDRHPDPYRVRRRVSARPEPARHPQPAKKPERAKAQQQPARIHQKPVAGHRDHLDVRHLQRRYLAKHHQRPRQAGQGRNPHIVAPLGVARVELVGGARVWPDVTLPDGAIRFSSDL